VACARALPERVPLPRFPQAEQASEVVRGERLAAHRVCTGTAKQAEELIQCMQGRGYTFIARGPGYPATECWEIRDAEAAERLTREEANRAAEEVVRLLAAG
jgi:hypothetical protein